MENLLFAVKFDFLCIVLYIVAVLLARKGKTPWVLLGIGAFVELLGFAGGFVAKTAATGEIVASIVLFAILTVVAIVLIRRRAKAVKTEE